MAKYIDQSVAIARLTHIEVTKPTATMTDAKRALADMFPANVESVVRCWECKYYKPDEFECGCDFAGGLPHAKADDFCSYGERKEE
jgi:hypothetical protein